MSTVKALRDAFADVLTPEALDLIGQGLPDVVESAGRVAAAIPADSAERAAKNAALGTVLRAVAVAMRAEA